VSTTGRGKRPASDSVKNERASDRTNAIENINKHVKGYLRTNKLTDYMHVPYSMGIVAEARPILYNQNTAEILGGRFYWG
jgi:hypothetical protein